MAATPLRFRPSTRHYPFTLSLSSLHLYRPLSAPPADDEVESIFRIMNHASSSQNMKQSLKSTGIFLSNDLIDRVLTRAKFSHSNPLQALEFFNYTGSRRGFHHTPFALDTMLYILGRNRHFDKLWEVLIDVKHKDRSLISPRTIQVVLGRISKVCSVTQTVEGFKKFRNLVHSFDTACFNALLRTLRQEKSMADARNVYHGLKKDFKPNLQTFNILLSGWKTAADAEEFLEEMKGMGVRPDIVTYNCLIDVYCKNNKLDEAYQVFYKIHEQGMSPNVITYTSLIGGLGLAGQPDRAREILREMKEAGCYPDVAAYNATIRNFCIVKRLVDAYQLVDEMVEMGLYPNAGTFNLFFRVFYLSNDSKNAWDLYRRMRKTGCLPDMQSCMFLIRLLKRHEKVDMALELWNDMMEKGFGSYILVSDELLDMLCDMGKLAEAEKCFLQMVDKGQKPGNVSFRRIRVLMELANRHEAIEKLSEKMRTFGWTDHIREENEDGLLVNMT